MTTNTDPVRALIAKWRGTHGSGFTSQGEFQAHLSTLRTCADELEAALASVPVGVEDDPIDASDNAEYIEHCADRLERCGLRVTAGALRVIAHEHRSLAQQPAAPSGEAVAWAAMSAAGSRVVSISLERDEYVGHVVPLYAAPQQPAGVDWDEVRRVAQHIANAADYIDKVYPGAETLNAGVILRNMRRWHERLTAAQQQGGAK